MFFLKLKAIYIAPCARMVIYFVVVVKPANALKSLINKRVYNMYPIAYPLTPKY